MPLSMSLDERLRAVRQQYQPEGQYQQYLTTARQASELGAQQYTLPGEMERALEKRDVAAAGIKQQITAAQSAERAVRPELRAQYAEPTAEKYIESPYQREALYTQAEETERMKVAGLEELVAQREGTRMEAVQTGMAGWQAMAARQESEADRALQNYQTALQNYQFEMENAYKTHGQLYQEESDRLARVFADKEFTERIRQFDVTDETERWKIDQVMEWNRESAKSDFTLELKKLGVSEDAQKLAEKEFDKKWDVHAKDKRDQLALEYAKIKATTESATGGGGLTEWQKYQIAAAEAEKAAAPNTPLSIDEATKLGVPYGTTYAEAAEIDLTPTGSQTEAEQKRAVRTGIAQDVADGISREEIVRKLANEGWSTDANSPFWDLIQTAQPAEGGGTSWLQRISGWLGNLGR